MNLQDHPGFLGWTSRGVLAIHADWPMYPSEHGIEESLWSLGQFPREATFRPIDMIDRCCLFVIDEPTSKVDPFDEKRFHVALWEDDIKQLFEHEFVECAESYGDGAAMSNTRLRSRPSRLEWFNGKFVATGPENTWLYEEAPIRLTNSGWRELDGLLRSDRVPLHRLVVERAIPIAEIGRYDSAVREACVSLESRLREIVGSDAYGLTLVGQFISLLPVPPFISAYVKVMRGDLRTAFKYVRNDYAHNLRVIDETQCRALLARLSVILESVDAAAQTLERERGKQG